MTGDELLNHIQTHPDHDHIKLVRHNVAYEHRTCHRICIMNHEHEEDPVPKYNPFIGAHPDEDVAWEDA